MTRPQILSTLRAPSILGLALLLACNYAVGNTLTGDVVSISDGDTVTVLDNTKTQHKVRLAGIDAPEKRQPFGDRSRQGLAAVVFRKHVVVHWHKHDRYGRIVGKVLVGGADVGLSQLRTGMAWHYKAYAREQSAEDRTEYAATEGVARARHIGLWQQADPIPPWDFRRSAGNRPAAKASALDDDRP